MVSQEKMLRLGMLGSDGGAKDGHALTTCQVIENGQYNAKIVAICGDKSDETETLAERMNIDFIAEKPEDLLGKVDAVFVMPRNGDRHLYYAMPFIKAGIPTFIDKPFTGNVEDAIKIVEEAKKSGAVICGGSSAKFAPLFSQMKKEIEEKPILSGYISFPVYLDSPHGGIHFYSHHLIEEVLTAFGTDVYSVTSTVVGENLVVVAKYSEFPVIMNFASNYGGLHGGLYFKDGTSMMETPKDSDGYRLQMEKFLDAVREGKGEDPSFYVLAVKISNAIVKSMEEKREVLIDEYK